MNTTPKKPLVYITRDIERALGTEPRGDYFIATNRTPHGETVAREYPDNVLLIGEKEMLDTYELLTHPEVQSFIEKRGADVVVFQNTSRIERLAEERGWTLLNPSASLSKTVEEKISQIEWLGELATYLPPHEVTTLEKVVFTDERFILQFNHSHTGEGTYLIDSETKLTDLRNTFPKRECRTVAYIEGPVFTANVVVADQTLVGNISFQITGLSPFTDLPLSTIGNDWKLPYTLLTKEQGAYIETMAQALGNRLRGAGWRGLFGIDVVLDEKTGKIYLLEINARQPASTTLESRLQKKTGDGLTVFDAHIRALRGEKLDVPLQKIKKGAQIVQRVTETRKKETLHVDRDTLTSIGCDIVSYENTELNKDLVRITTNEGIMSTPQTLNTHGQAIASSLS